MDRDFTLLPISTIPADQIKQFWCMSFRPRDNHVPSGSTSTSTLQGDPQMAAKARTSLSRVDSFALVHFITSRSPFSVALETILVWCSCWWAAIVLWCGGGQSSDKVWIIDVIVSLMTKTFDWDCNNIQQLLSFWWTELQQSQQLKWRVMASVSRQTLLLRVHHNPLFVLLWIASTNAEAMSLQPCWRL